MDGINAIRHDIAAFFGWKAHWIDPQDRAWASYFYVAERAMLHATHGVMREEYLAYYGLD